MYPKYYECYTEHDHVKVVVFLLTGKNRSGFNEYITRQFMRRTVINQKWLQKIWKGHLQWKLSIQLSFVFQIKYFKLIYGILNLMLLSTELEKTILLLIRTFDNKNY